MQSMSYFSRFLCLLCILLVNKGISIKCEAIHEEPLSSVVNEVQSNHRNLEVYNILSKGIVHFLWDDVPKLIANQNLNLSKECARSLFDTHNGLRGGHPWAFRLIDASGKIPAGLLEGTISGFGDYDQCLEVRANDHHIAPFVGQYCMIKLYSVNNAIDRNETQTIGSKIADTLPLFARFSLNNAICMPSTCSEKEIAVLVKQTIATKHFQVEDSLYCETSQSIAFDWRRLSVIQVVAIIYVSLMVTIVFWSTVFDVHYAKTLKGYSDMTRAHVLRVFSANYNTSKLFTLDTVKGRMGSVDDMRFLYAIVAATLHSYSCGIEVNALPKLARLETDFQEKFSPVWMQPLYNVVAIEAFFCIGGMTSVFSTYSLLKNNVNFGSISGAILSRWFRLAPGVISLLALDFVWPLFGSGPLYTELTSSLYDNCSKNWWKTVLFISNWSPVDEMCLVHTWYISAEFQLFILGVFAVSVLLVSPKAGYFLSCLMIALGMIIPGYKAYVYKYPPAFISGFADFEKALLFVNQMYFPSHCHLTSYFIGILIGYQIKNGFSLELTKSRRLICHVLFVPFVVISYFPAIWNSFDYPVDLLTSTLYVIFHKFFWTFGFLALLVITADFNKKMFVALSNGSTAENSSDNNNRKENKNSAQTESQSDAPKRRRSELQRLLLIWTKCFGRLYFALYLVHTVFIRWDFFTSRQLFQFNVFSNGCRGLYSIFGSFLMAYYFHILFEAPFENIRRRFKGSLEKKKIE